MHSIAPLLGINPPSPTSEPELTISIIARFGQATRHPVSEKNARGRRLRFFRRRGVSESHDPGGARLPGHFARAGPCRASADQGSSPRSHDIPHPRGRSYGCVAVRKKSSELAGKKNYRQTRSKDRSAVFFRICRSKAWRGILTASAIGCLLACLVGRSVS